MAVGQRSEGSISLWLPGPEDLRDFPMEQELAETGLLVQAKWGINFSSVLFDHSLGRVLAGVEVNSR